MESLQYMKSILLKRPTSFNSRDEAVVWVYQSKRLRSKASVEASVDSLIYLDKPTGKYAWRTDLLKSEPYWRGKSQSSFFNEYALALQIHSEFHQKNGLKDSQLNF